MHNHHQIGRAFCDGHTNRADIARQARLGNRHTVLDLHLCGIEIGTDVKSDLNREAAIATGIRRDIKHVLDTIDLLLDRRNDSRGNNLCAGTGILARYVDDRRGNFWILRNRQTNEGDSTQNHDDNRNDR